MELKQHEVALWFVDEQPDFVYPLYSFILEHSVRVLEEDRLAKQMTARVDATQQQARLQGRSIGETRTTDRGEAIELDEPVWRELVRSFGVPEQVLSNMG